MHICTRAGIIPSLLTLAFLSGCSVGPDYEGMRFAAPAQWSSKGDVTPQPPELAFWWKSFNDPMLDKYIERSVARNLSVAAAKARVREARALLAQERGGLLPALSNSTSVTRARTASTGAQPAVTGTQHQVGFDASWEIDLFGGRTRSVEAASYGLDASSEELRNAMLVLVGDVASTYAQVRGTQARLELARRTARSQRSTAALTRTRLENGTANAADVARAEALAATTEAEIPALEIVRAASVHRLGVLLGRAPGELSAELSKPGRVPRPAVSVNVGIPAQTLLNRPDVRVAERRLAQATARIGAAEAARYPALSITGTIASQAVNIADLGAKSTIAWSLGPSLTVPIFQGGRLKAGADAARAGRDVAFATYQSSILTAMEDVENGIVALTQNRLRAGKLATAVSAYQRAAAATNAQYEAGALGYLELLDGQRALYSAESDLIESRLAVVQAYIALNKALGGGWPGFTDVTKELVIDSRTGPRLRAVGAERVAASE